jgi:4-hydroxybenzoyl-CoA thioesterase
VPGSKKFEKSTRIRFAHCDPAGIVFFPQYLVLFNGLVEDWFTDALGVSYADFFNSRRIGLPIVRLECDFRAISRQGDEITLALEPQRLGRSSLTLDFECRAQDQPRVTSRQVLVFTDLDSHRSIEMPPDVRQSLSHFISNS